jgi:hypothetical protein
MFATKLENCTLASEGNLKLRKGMPWHDCATLVKRLASLGKPDATVTGCMKYEEFRSRSPVCVRIYDNEIPAW